MQEEYYLKVDDCPLKAWRKANEGDLKWLRSEKGKGTKEQDKKAWEELQDDFLRQIGLSKDYAEYLDLLRERAILQLEYLKSERKRDGITIRNRALLNKIKILDVQINEHRTGTGKGLTMHQVLMRLSKMQGYHIKETEISVLEYHNLLKEYSDGKAD